MLHRFTSLTTPHYDDAGYAINLIWWFEHDSYSILYIAFHSTIMVLIRGMIDDISGALILREERLYYYFAFHAH